MMKHLTSSFSMKMVASSWQFIRKLPSPSMSITTCSATEHSKYSEQTWSSEDCWAEGGRAKGCREAEKGHCSLQRSSAGMSQPLDHEAKLNWILDTVHQAGQEGLGSELLAWVVCYWPGWCATGVGSVLLVWALKHKRRSHRTALNTSWMQRKSKSTRHDML